MMHVTYIPTDFFPFSLSLSPLFPFFFQFQPAQRKLDSPWEGKLAALFANPATFRAARPIGHPTGRRIARSNVETFKTIGRLCQPGVEEIASDRRRGGSEDQWTIHEFYFESRAGKLNSPTRYQRPSGETQNEIADRINSGKNGVSSAGDSPLRLLVYSEVARGSDGIDRPSRSRSTLESNNELSCID